MDAMPAPALFSREKFFDNLIIRDRRAQILSVCINAEGYLIPSVYHSRVIIIHSNSVVKEKVQYVNFLAFWNKSARAEMELLKIQVQELCCQIPTISLCSTERMIPIT